MDFTGQFEEGRKRVRIDEPLGAFGDLVTRLHPQIQIHFAYNVNSRLVDENVVGSGSVTIADGQADMRTGSTASSSVEDVEFQ